jgi:hypothetical protein
VAYCPESVRWSDHYYSVPRFAVENRCAHFQASSGVGNRGCVRVVESRSAAPAGGSLSLAVDPPLPLSGTAFRALFWRLPPLVAPRRICFPSLAPNDIIAFCESAFAGYDSWVSAIPIPKLGGVCSKNRYPQEKSIYRCVV